MLGVSVLGTRPGTVDLFLSAKQTIGVKVQSAKQALLKAGRIDAIKRGRISLDNHAWLKTQYDQGVRFTDWPKGEVQTTKSETGATEVRVKRDASQTQAKVVYDIGDFRFPEKSFEAYEFVDGKKKSVSLRECCNTCRVSLVNHACDEPTYLNNRKVFIVPVKKG